MLPFVRGPHLYVFFRQYIPFTCCGHLVRSIVRIFNLQLMSVTFVIFDHPLVNLRLPKYPFLYLPTLVPDFYGNNIFVVIRLKIRYIIAVH